MSSHRLRLAIGGARQRRLAELLGGRDPGGLGLADVVSDAQALGSLELAGFRFRWEEVRAARRGADAPAPIRALQRAQAAVAPDAPFSAGALLAWQAPLAGAACGWRRAERARPAGPQPAPLAFLAARLEVLEQWLGSPSARELAPAQLGALALARVVELAPFDDANGRVSRLAASHLMVRAGGRPPVLAGGDGPRLETALAAAFRLDTEPLAALLEEASERAVEVMIQTLQSESP